MIALLIAEISEPRELEYYKSFSNKIYTTNKDINYLDKNILSNSVLLENFIHTNKLDGILYLKSEEKIKLFDFSDFSNRSQNVCISDKKWIVKEKRLFSHKINIHSDNCQSIILLNENKTFEHPIIDNNLHSLANEYKNKNYRGFVIEAEKWLFDNAHKGYNQIMVRYYCALVYYFKLKDLRKSLEHIGLALLLAPSMVELWCAWGDILLAEKQYEKALSIFKNAVLVKKERNIFDNNPIWIERNEEYSQSMLEKTERLVKNIMIITNVQ